jgi:cation:H+ antiporter
MFLQIGLLIIGFLVLIKGADFLVNGASSLAKKFNISNLAIGLTVVAFGTSAPEMVVSVLSATNGKSDASFGNVIGSNNFNLFFILGVSGMIYPLVVHRNTVKFEVPFSIFTVVLMYVLVNDALLWESHTAQGKYAGELSRTDSVILLMAFLGFMYYIYRTMQNTTDLADEAGIKLYSTPVGLGLSLLGIAMLVGGGKLVVESATTIAHHFGLSEKLIGLTILATGTSLPEMATSAVAAYRKNTDIAIGNVVGSNIFNILLILGVTGLIHPIPYNASLNFDIKVFAGGTLMLMIFMFTLNQRKLDRWEAFLLFGGYITYTIYLIATDTAM